MRALRDISSLCLRVAGQWRGAADALMPHLWDEQGRVRSLLIVGLPGMGKTTMLRDACRRLSERGARMCVVDERSEIAAMSGGVPQLDVGPNTDVLDGCAKEAGLRWMLRAMSPQALVTDELGGTMDAQAVLDAARSGVSVLATLHGRDLQAALSRGILYHLAQNRVFDRYALLDENEVGCVRAVCDEQLRPLEAAPCGRGGRAVLPAGGYGGGQLASGPPGQAPAHAARAAGRGGQPQADAGTGAHGPDGASVPVCTLCTHRSGGRAGIAQAALGLSLIHI